MFSCRAKSFGYRSRARLQLLVAFMVMCTLYTPPALADSTGWLTVYSENSMLDCTVDDEEPGLLTVHVVPPPDVTPKETSEE